VRYMGWSFVIGHPSFVNRAPEQMTTDNDQ
jgi:hypothetical protein